VSFSLKNNKTINDGVRNGGGDERWDGGGLRLCVLVWMLPCVGGRTVEL